MLSDSRKDIQVFDCPPSGSFPPPGIVRSGATGILERHGGEDKGYAQRLKTDYRELREKRGKSARQAARLTCLESGLVSGASRPACRSFWHCSMPLSVVWSARTSFRLGPSKYSCWMAPIAFRGDEIQSPLAPRRTRGLQRERNQTNGTRD